MENINNDIAGWICRNKRKLKGNGPETKQERLERLIELSQERCKWTNLPLKFDKESGESSGESPTDPLYAEVDHRVPGTNEQGHDLVCHYVNDVKGQLPWKLWLALTRLPVFEEWVVGLRDEYKQIGTLRGRPQRAAPTKNDDFLECLILEYLNRERARRVSPPARGGQSWSQIACRFCPGECMVRNLV